MKNALSVLTIFAACLAHGQTFDAASVKPTAPPDKNGMVNMGTEGGPGTKDPGRMQYRYLTMKTLLMTAYDVKAYRISGPAWIDTERFDIVATLPRDATKEQCRIMLQNLLAERFKIALHRETRELPVYSLTVAKGGPKMNASAAVAVPDDAAEPAAPAHRPKLGPDGFVALEEIPASAPIGVVGFPGRAHMAGRWKTMEELADWLAANLHRPVSDATALKGKYDFALNYAPETANAPAAAAPDAEPLPDIFGALQSELGLKLEAKKGPVEMIVIDRIEKTPAGN